MRGLSAWNDRFCFTLSKFWWMNWQWISLFQSLPWYTDEAKWMVPATSPKALNVGDPLQDLWRLKSFKSIKSYSDYVLGFLCFCDIWPHMWWEICTVVLPNMSLPSQKKRFPLSHCRSHTDTQKKIQSFIFDFFFFCFCITNKITSKITNTVALTTNNSCTKTTNHDEVELKQARRILS